MNLLVIGGGGREHALVWALRRNPEVETVWAAPGNAGIAGLARCVSLNVDDPKAVLSFIQEKNIGLTVVGPEAPLVAGLPDALREAGRRVFGPGRAAARLEGSKVFAKNFMRTYGIPTADFKTFSFAEEALAHVRSSSWDPPFRVVKASGLAAGKGVTVCRDREETLKALEEAMVRKAFGAAGDQVVLERALEGEELSVMALCDGASLVPLLTTQDHKRALDGDQGPNTGGMGAYGPVPRVDAGLWKIIEQRVFAPFLKGLREENLDYAGVIYFGLMLTKDGPQALEFNVRFGDPETQVILPMIETDWLDLFQATVDRRLAGKTADPRAGSGVCVVMAAGGYPGPYEKGRAIEGLDAWEGREDVMVFHAGTVRDEATGTTRTAGGRVLGVTALAADFADARRKAYQAVESIRFEGAHYRRDIAVRALS